MTAPDSQHQRESAFHDQWAQSTDLESVRPEQFFSHPTSLENRFLLEKMERFHGLSVLDVGCGLGESSVFFAQQGADVTALDLSPEMVRLTERLAERHQVHVEGVAHAGEDLPFADESFDLVYLANIIHHVEDRKRLYREVHRVLRPGGQFFSWDPVAYNPAINLYRRIATDVRTPDEQPLKMKDLRQIRSVFPEVEVRFTWLLALTLFGKFALIDRLDPNQVRYWKQILTLPEEKLGWWKRLARWDSYLTRLPGLRWWSWNISIWGRKNSHSEDS